MNNLPVIQLHNIYKTYQTGVLYVEALKNINLEVAQNEYLAVLGPSGSGKSTLMQILGCLSTPTSGSYLLDGKEVSKLSKNELAVVRNEKIGFVFQNFNLLAHASTLENVELPLVYRGVPAKQRQAAAKEILTKLGLANHFEHHPNELSGGQKQRVAISRALVTNPEIILADEPTGNLDSKAGNTVIDLFEQLHAEGKTIIIITHDLQVAKRARRIISIHDGAIQ
jgi:putative ABC transport system ATP-binding protein